MINSQARACVGELVDISIRDYQNKRNSFPWFKGELSSRFNDVIIIELGLNTHVFSNLSLFSEKQEMQIDFVRFEVTGLNITDLSIT